MTVRNEWSRGDGGRKSVQFMGLLHQSESLVRKLGMFTTVRAVSRPREKKKFLLVWGTLEFWKGVCVLLVDPIYVGGGRPGGEGGCEFRGYLLVFSYRVPRSRRLTKKYCTPETKNHFFIS